MIRQEQQDPLRKLKRKRNVFGGMVFGGLALLSHSLHISLNHSEKPEDVIRYEEAQKTLEQLADRKRELYSLGDFNYETPEVRELQDFVRKQNGTSSYSILLDKAILSTKEDMDAMENEFDDYQERLNNQGKLALKFWGAGFLLTMLGANLWRYINKDYGDLK